MKKEHEKIVTSVMGVEPIRINSELVSGQLRNRLYWTNINGGHIQQPRNTGTKFQDVLIKGYTDREKARTLLESDSRPLTTPVKMFHRYYATGFTSVIFKDKTHYWGCKKHYDENFKNLSAKDIDIKIKELNVDCSVYQGLRYLDGMSFNLGCKIVIYTYFKFIQYKLSTRHAIETAKNINQF